MKTKTKKPKTKKAPTPAQSLAQSTQAPALDIDYGFVTGIAGSGKSHLIRQMTHQNPSWGLICATTGVAARILGAGVPTVNAACGFFDLAHLRRAQKDGMLLKNLQTLKQESARLVIDECSMLDAETLTILTETAQQVGLGIILVGDFCQLPPVTENHKRPNWIFSAPIWNLFEQNIIRLTTQYRQTSPAFLTGLNLLRRGDGTEAIPFLKDAGVTFSQIPSAATQPDDIDFHGLTIVSTNATKRAIDSKRYDAIEGEEFIYLSKRWGNQQSDWKEIPDVVSVKVGARVMILRNKYDKELVYANGETGVVTQCLASGVQITRDDGKEIFVEIAETDDAHRQIVVGGKNGVRQVKVTKKATGGIQYLPLSRAWALTVHKARD